MSSVTRRTLLPEKSYMSTSCNQITATHRPPLWEAMRKAHITVIIISSLTVLTGSVEDPQEFLDERDVVELLGIRFGARNEDGLEQGRGHA